MRFELMTSSLPRKRSTPELHRRKVLVSVTLKTLRYIFQITDPASAGITKQPKHFCLVAMQENDFLTVFL